MDKYNFIRPILIFVAFQCLSILAVPFASKGKKIAYGANILGTLFLAVFFAMNLNSEFYLTDLFYLDATKIKVLFVVSLFNILISVLNGHKRAKDVWASMLSTFMYLGSIFLIGSTEFVTFFVALEMISLMNYAQISLSDLPNSKEAAIKYYIQGSIFTAIFLLSLALFFGSTGDFNFMDFTVRHQQLYVFSVALMFTVLCFKIGAFPFQAWMPDVYSSVDKGNLASNFLITKLVVGYSFLTVLLRLINEADPSYQQFIIYGVLTISVLNAFYGNIVGLAQSQFKRVIAYSSMAHAGYMIMTLALQVNEGYESQLLFYLTFYSVTATGAILLINRFIENANGEDTYEALKGGFYKDPLSGALLCLFGLGLAGMPLTAGFSTKYLLFTNYFREGLNLEATVVLLSSIIGLGYYIRFIVALFMEESTSSDAKVLATASGQALSISDFKAKFMAILLAALVVAGGIAPSLFLK